MKKTDSRAKRLLLDLLNGRQTLEGHVLNQVKPGSLVCMTGDEEAGQDPALRYIIGEGEAGRGYTPEEIEAKGALCEGGVITITEILFKRGDNLQNISSYIPTLKNQSYVLQKG